MLDFAGSQRCVDCVRRRSMPVDRGATGMSVAGASGDSEIDANGAVEGVTLVLLDWATLAQSLCQGGAINA